MNKVNIKLLLWESRPKDDGTLPVYIRITINRDSKYISTEHSLHPDFWNDEKQRVRDSHPSSANINNSLKEKLNSLERMVLEANVTKKQLTARMLKTMYQSSGDVNNIFEFLEVFKEEVKSKREASTIENYRKHLLTLELFNKSKNLLFADIDHKFLVKFESHLRKTVGGNYVHAIFKTIRTIFNAAIKRGVTKHYPFSTYEFPEYEAPDKDYLTDAELKKWEEFANTTTDPVLKQTAIWFLFGCYAGMRISDWMRFTEKNIDGDHIRLRAKKNGEWVKMPISKPLARNITRMIAVPLTLAEATLNEKVKVIAEIIGLDKHLTTHTGRHTFAVTICLNNKVSSETAAELMGITLQTFVDNYSQVTDEKIDRETKDAWKRLK